MELKGKQLSLWSKLGALFFLLACFALIVFAKIQFAVDDAIKVSIFIALLFSPVDISLWLEKFSPGTFHRKTIPADGKGDEAVSV
jgi:hypothetical protein